MEQEQPQTFGALLRRYRLAAGLTQEQLAERAGLTAQAVSTLERGFRRAPYRDTVQALALALALPPVDVAVLEAAVERSRGAGAVVPNTARPALPTPPTRIIGREREAAEVAGLLRPDDGTVRLLTLAGSGGVGKTRLALEVAHALQEQYPDGAVFVDLAPLRDPALVEATIAHVLRVEESAGRPLAAALRLHLRDQCLLLVLDNFEHVVGAVPLVADLLAACPALRVLATSRARLQLRGEQIYPVPPLGVPDPERLPSLTALAQIPAVALLLQRARAAAPDFVLEGSNAEAVASLCARLDGLPLALELAAARLSVLSPTLLLRRLSPRLPLLTGGPRDLPVRQQTLRATLDWSYALLSPAAQVVFRRLCVFAGGCTLEAAETVCRTGPGEPPDVLAGLEALVDQSILRHTMTAETGEGRFVLLETMREYGLERLEASGETTALRHGHAAAMLALVEEAEFPLQGAEQAAWLTRLEAEHDNLRAALRWAQQAEDRHEVGTRLVAAIWPLWAMRGYVSEGRSWLERFLAPTRGGAQPTSGPSTAVRAKALDGAGLLAFAQGDFARAAQLHGASLVLYRELEDRSGIARTLNSLGILALGQGDYAWATRLLEESLALARDLGDRRITAHALSMLGHVAMDQGDHARGTGLYEQSIALFGDLGYKWGIAWCLEGLARPAATPGTAPPALERAARFLGTAAALRAALGAPLGAMDRATYERTVAVLRAGLSNAMFETAWVEGQTMTLERAVAAALAAPHAPTSPPWRSESPPAPTAGAPWLDGCDDTESTEQAVMMSRHAPSWDAAVHRPPVPSLQRGGADGASSARRPSRKERQAWAVEHLRAAGPLSPRAYARAVSVSVDTALRDLQALVDQGVVQAVGTTKDRCYRLMAEVAEPPNHRITP